MGWFSGTPNQSGSADKDPLRNLEPSLREFLRKESPIKYESQSTPSSGKSRGSAERTEQGLETSENATRSDSTRSVGQTLPPPLVYKDGRYSHLWKSYQSPEEIDNYMKSDQEKIDEILEGFKYRRAEIGKAALENCALEQEALSECWSHGSAQARLMLCRTENKAFNRCHTMQFKLLKALGYLSTLERPKLVDERIQMHADTLYHKMLQEEKEVEAARANGLPLPKFPPLLAREHIDSSEDSEAEAARKDVHEAMHSPSTLKKSVREQLKERLDKLTHTEREIEELAIKAEIRAGESLGGNLTGIQEKQDLDRKTRKEQGKETVGDKIISLFAFGSGSK